MALTQYDLTRQFWNFTFANPELVKPTHIAIYFFAVEHCNRLGWNEKFGLPTSMVLNAIGVKSYNSYKKHFDDLVTWRMFKVIEYSKNQYSSNIIALLKNDKAINKALDRAIVLKNSDSPIKKEQSESESTVQSTVQSTGESTGSIIKPITNNHKPSTTTQPEPEFEISLYQNLIDYKFTFLKDSFCVGLISQKGVNRNSIPGWLDAFNRRLIFTADTLKSERDYRSHFSNWLVRVPNYRTLNPEDYSPAADPEIKATTTQSHDDIKKLFGK